MKRLPFHLPRPLWLAGRWLFSLALALSLTLSAWGATPAYAATLTVTNANDSGAGSLRQAISDAASGDTIQFANDYSILLASTLTISKNLTIDGAGHSITLNGNNAVRVFNINAGFTVNLSNLKVINGRASSGHGGGIYNAGTLTVTNSTFSGNSASNGTGNGGGIYNVSRLTVTNSVFSGNSATKGGGIANSSANGNCASSVAASIKNSTFNGNSAGSGGGIYNDNGVMEISHSTITANSSGGGLWSYNDNLNCVRVGGSIIAGNAGYDVGANYTIQRFYSLGYNLVGIAGPRVDFTQEFNATGDQTNVTAPLLGTLGNYGGATQTVPLLPGSPAINAGNDAACPTTDQRGAARFGVHCDIGAFESQGFTLGSLSGTPQSASVNTAFASPLGLTVTANDPAEPVNGGLVTFTPPASGASASLDAALPPLPAVKPASPPRRTTPSARTTSLPAPQARPA